MFNYPRTNFHELNLDWILSELKKQSGECVFTKPEDFTDSENPVQDCLNFAADNNKIVLLSGMYDIYETLEPAEGCVIYGINGATLISHAQDVPGFAPVTLLKAPSNFYIESVNFDGNRPDGASQSLIPADLNPGETLTMAPLVFVDGVFNVNFVNCQFYGYDCNRSTSYPSYNYSALGCVGAEFVSLIRCVFYNCWREISNFNNCNNVNIIDCIYNSSGGAYEDDNNIWHNLSYTEIGLLETNHVNIRNCYISKDENNTTSVINAMGTDITINDCDIYAPSSTYGIDYGNEIGNNFTFENLIISFNRMNCRIGAANTYNVQHDNVVITDNIINTTGLKHLSGAIMIDGNNGEMFNIENNVFKGTLVTPTTSCIRLTKDAVVKVNISENIFSGRAIYISEDIPDLTIKNNLFYDDVIYQSNGNATPQTIVIIGSRCERAGRFGAVAAGSDITVVLVGCDFRRDILTNATAVDSTLSYIRGV